ncbi:MAG: LamG domain-containing protein, partial [Planctomycetota bacterium]
MWNVVPDEGFRMRCARKRISVPVKNKVLKIKRFWHLVLVLALSGVVHADPCDANLIGLWTFDEGDGNTVEDSSAYNNDGVTTSPTPTWVAGYPGDPCDSAMDFDGASDYLVCAVREGNTPGTYPAELMPDKFTVSLWTKLDSFGYYEGFVSNGYEDGACGFFLQNGGNGNNFGMSMGTTTGWWDIETPTIYETDRWYHLTAVYDGQYASVYVDGYLAAGPDNVSTITWVWEGANDVNGYPSSFVIGTLTDEGYGDPGLPVDGVIDEVRFYNYAM